MTVNCARLRETEEKEYHHNISMAAVFDSIYGCLYSQAGVKGTGVLTYGI